MSINTFENERAPRVYISYAPRMSFVLAAILIITVSLFLAANPSVSGAGASAPAVLSVPAPAVTRALSPSEQYYAQRAQDDLARQRDLATESEPANTSRSNLFYIVLGILDVGLLGGLGVLARR